MNLLVTGAIACHVSGRLRRAIILGHTDAADLLRNSEEMRREADINRAEFRTITSVLGKKLADGPA